MLRSTIPLAVLLIAAPALQAQDKPAPEISFSATVLMNGFYTSDKTNNSDLPQFAVRQDASDSFPSEGVGATLRQTRVQARAFAAGVLGGDFTALVDVAPFPCSGSGEPGPG